MKRNLIALAILLAIAGAANAFELGLGNRFGKFGVLNNKGTSSAPSICAGVIDASLGCPLPMLGM